MDIVEKYKELACRVYMATHPTVSRDKVMSILTDLMNETFKDIPCQMHNDIKHERINTTVKNVLEWVDTRKPIISGSGAFFKQHDEYLAPAGVMLQQLMKDRSAVKNEMWNYDKRSSEYTNLNTQQLSIKVIMNADYGASGTVLSPFFSPYIPPATTGTAKNLTTTLICCLEMASSNKDKYAKINSINELYDMIFKVLDDEEDRNIIEDTFDKKECEVSTKDLRQVSNYVLNNSYALDKVADEEIFMEDYDEISIKGGKLASEEEINNLIKEVNARIK